MIVTAILAIGFIGLFAWYLHRMGPHEPEAEQRKPDSRSVDQVLLELEFRARRLRELRPKCILIGRIPVFRPRTEEDGDEI